jgi:hypothetical protein
VAVEIQIARLRIFGTVHRPRGCRAPATRLARYTDGQGRPLKQRELCERHADWLKANRPNVHDMRNDPDAREKAAKSLRVVSRRIRPDTH